MSLAGRRGRVIEDTYSAAGLELARQAWLQDDDSAIALRLRLANTSARDMVLDALIPWAAQRPEALLVRGRAYQS
jgi:hypothetical protein